jgi:hypothetical protein
MTGWVSRSEQFLINILAGLALPLVAFIGALGWNWVSQGGVVRALGGVTLSEVNGIAIPREAIVGFDLPACPAGWLPVYVYEQGYLQETPKKPKAADSRNPSGTLWTAEPTGYSTIAYCKRDAK